MVTSRVLSSELWCSHFPSSHSISAGLTGLAGAPACRGATPCSLAARQRPEPEPAPVLRPQRHPAREPGHDTWPDRAPRMPVTGPPSLWFAVAWAIDLRAAARALQALLLVARDRSMIPRATRGKLPESGVLHQIIPAARSGASTQTGRTLPVSWPGLSVFQAYSHQETTFPFATLTRPRLEPRLTKRLGFYKR